MPFVVDVSVMMAGISRTSDRLQADAIRAKAADDEIVVPSHWWFELRNVLLIG